MIAITSGIKFTDIDMLTCCFAMKEICTLLNKESRIILPLNYSPSIIPEMFSWCNISEIISIEDYEYPEEEIYIFDISEQAFLSPKLDFNKVKLLYDHHHGFEEEWKDYKIDDLKIEKIGASATQVFELYKRYNLLDKISTNIANLIYVTIITHTLNFNSGVTTERDRIALKEVSKYCTIDMNWIADYYKIVEKEILANLYNSIVNDTKISTIQGNQVAFGQIELWEGNHLIISKKEEIIKALQEPKLEEYLFSVPSISEGKNYVFTNSFRLEKLLIELMNFQKAGDLLISNKLYLRKEILKIIQ